MITRFNISVQIVCALLFTVSLHAFEYTVNLPESIREGTRGKGEVHLMVAGEEEVIIAGIKVPEESDHLIFHPGPLSVSAAEGDQVRWTFTCEIEALKTGRVVPEPFRVSYFAGMPEGEEQEPQIKELEMPQIEIKPPLFFMRSGVGWILLDLFILAGFAGIVIYLFRRRRRKTDG